MPTRSYVYYGAICSGFWLRTGRGGVVLGCILSSEASSLKGLGYICADRSVWRFNGDPARDRCWTRLMSSLQPRVVRVPPPALCWRGCCEKQSLDSKPGLGCCSVAAPRRASMPRWGIQPPARGPCQTAVSLDRRVYHLTVSLEPAPRRDTQTQSQKSLSHGQSLLGVQRPSSRLVR